MRVLILGGYGVFGGRLAQLLSDEPRLTLLIAGRSQDKAQAFCDAFDGAATALPAQVDRADIVQALAAWTPDVVVDASGPFQDYGADQYAVIRACIDAGVHYLDFADAANFVFGVDAFDAAAKDAGVFVLSGVSSFPVLTAAVLREIAKGMEIRDVRGGIAPSPYAGIGLNVMRAVVGYAGGPVKLWRDGAAHVAKGLTESLRYTIAPPGEMPLRNLHFSLVDVPDLRVIPPAHPGLQSIWMGAGPVPEVLHRMLNLLARARALFRLPPLTPLSPLFYRVLNLMKFGEHRGGMFVEADGLKDGQSHTMSWHLLAEGDDGPYIPSMAIEVILRKLLDGHAPANGARPATEALDLADYDRAFDGRTITTGWREATADATVYRQVLGGAYDDLPSSLQRLHDLRAPMVWSGKAKVTAGRGPLARLVARIFGFPTQDGELPVSVSFDLDGKGEVWRRDFDGARFESRQRVGRGRNANLLVESFGPFDFGLALVVKEGQLHLIPRRWSIWGLPLPRLLMPGGPAFEAEVDGTFQFNVVIAAPIIGPIVHYRGWLERDVGKGAMG